MIKEWVLSGSVQLTRESLLDLALEGGHDGILGKFLDHYNSWTIDYINKKHMVHLPKGIRSGKKAFKLLRKNEEAGAK